MAGLLRIRGSIDLDQFWPDGSADADTTKIKVDVSKGSFAYAVDGKTFKTTHVFDKAVVKGAKKAPLISAKGQITVRLQGIDAPELHYKAAALKRSDAISDKKRATFNAINREERRQHWAESATVALSKKLRSVGKGPIPCLVYSFIDRPTELPDTYGRVVGNIRVGAKFATDVNLWLVSEAWAFPTFYSSMSKEEIESYLVAAAKGKKKKRVFTSYSRKLSKFDWKLVYRKNGEIDEAHDRGDVIKPKLFRRQVAWKVQGKAKVFSGSFADYLAANRDNCFLTDDFLKEGVHTATPHTLHEFMKGASFTLTPQELVFKEKFSALVDAKGKPIESF